MSVNYILRAFTLAIQSYLPRSKHTNFSYDFHNLSLIKVKINKIERRTIKYSEA